MENHGHTTTDGKDIYWRNHEGKLLCPHCVEDKTFYTEKDKERIKKNKDISKIKEKLRVMKETVLRTS